MRLTVFISAVYVVAITLSSCANKGVSSETNTERSEPKTSAAAATGPEIKKEEQQAVEIEEGKVEGAYYQRVMPGTEDGEVTIKLVIPVSSPHFDIGSADSVYFMGYKARLTKRGRESNASYHASFGLKSGQKENPPAELDDTQAILISYSVGERYFLRIDGIEEGEVVYAP